jgi:hypothetical protein
MCVLYPGSASASEPCQGLVRSVMSNEVMPKLPLEVSKRSPHPASTLSMYAPPSIPCRSFIPCLKVLELSKLLEILDDVKACVGRPFEMRVTSILAVFNASA